MSSQARVRNPFRPKNVLLASTAMIIASLLATGCGSSDEPTGDNVDNVSPTAAASSDGLQGGDAIVGGSDAAKTVENTVDNTHGVQIFGSSAFGAYTKGASDHAPYGAKLDVTCYVINNTGQYTSVNALYHIKGGKWDDGWVPANVMLNDAKAPLGSTDTPALDPRVKACK